MEREREWYGVLHRITLHEKRDMGAGEHEMVIVELDYTTDWYDALEMEHEHIQTIIAETGSCLSMTIQATDNGRETTIVNGRNTEQVWKVERYTAHTFILDMKNPEVDWDNPNEQLKKNLIRAYLLLLMNHKYRDQEALCGMRELISKVTGASSRNVQETSEYAESIMRVNPTLLPNVDSAVTFVYVSLEGGK